ISTEDVNKFHEIILNQTGRLNSLIGDMLELHRLENTSNTVSGRKPVLWNEVVDELKSQYRDCGKKLQFRETDEAVYVRREHLDSLLVNLVDNAVKYSSGDIVAIEMTHSGKTVTICVSDEGPTIPADQRERIFERFYTISKSRNRRNGGTGLGLSIVKHIATLYKGSVSVEENKQGGNSFTVRLKE
ncbi:MAG: two-component sensor histidine kinase, partial [Acidobacteria bacterium CG_4_9_14_3_um_filter_49_7]